jgi:Domain of unknown function (DUF4276)
VNIQPVVEGHGEVAAVPVLLRRLRDIAKLFEWDVNPPIRRKRSELVQDAELRRSIRLARIQPDCGAILVLFDSDDDCPGQLGPSLQRSAQQEAGTVPCCVALAHREYEAWFLASIESLRGRRGIKPDAVSHPRPEEPRGAKGHLEQRMHARLTYSERADQPALTAVFDMKPAYGKCRSFRHLVRAFGDLVCAGGSMLNVPWPPVEWQVGQR